MTTYKQAYLAVTIDKQITIESERIIHSMGIEKEQIQCSGNVFVVNQNWYIISKIILKTVTHSIIKTL